MFTRLSLIATVLSLAVFVTLAAAGGPNQNRGKTLFKNGCKTCHIKGGEAKDLTPMGKTQAQWDRAFKNIDPMAQRVAKKTGKPLTATDLDDMKAYLVAHAADSDQPETCGIK